MLLRRVAGPVTVGWIEELQRWLAPFLAALGHKSRRRWAPVYLQGLIGPGDRKSVQPMAARVAPADHEQLHHFIATSAWDLGPCEAALAHEFSRQLFQAGVFAQSVGYPTVPHGKARIRTIVTATHNEEQLNRALDILEAVGKKLRIV